VIFATGPARAEQASDNLFWKLPQDADLFGSLTPKLGGLLSQAVAQEERARPASAQTAGQLC